MHVAITGATGLIGTALAARLRAGGHRVVRLVRHDPAPDDIEWDPSSGHLDAARLAGIDAVVNLTGAGIGDKRWTDGYRRTIRDSRVASTDLLSRTLAVLDPLPKVLLSGSAIGYYGDRGDELLDERSPAGSGFLPDVCRAWEGATSPAAEAGVRVAHLRTGIVLAGHGGALRKQLPLFKLGLGGRFGSGRQWQSWIHLDDEVGAIEHLLTADVEGPVNLTSPNPVTNAAFGSTLGRVLHRPAFVPVPKFGPRLLLGSELADSLLFEGQRVVPAILQASGYEFRYPELEGALRAALDRPVAA
jgi:uncharacterized protein (TIGR01777 family)